MAEDTKDRHQDVQDRIRELAYLLWEAAGRQHGLSLDYWLAAEKEVLTQMEVEVEEVTLGGRQNEGSERTASEADREAHTESRASQGGSAIDGHEHADPPRRATRRPSEDNHSAVGSGLQDRRSA